MPVKVVTVAASIATVVLPSRVFRPDAATEASVTDIVNAFTVSVIALRELISPSLIVAVTIPDVLAAIILNWATVIVPDTVIYSLPRPVIVPAETAV